VGYFFTFKQKVEENNEMLMSVFQLQ